MIEFPTGVHPNGAAPSLIDFGGVQESAGGSATRIERPGNKFEVEFSFPAMTAEDARVVLARLVRAKTEGLRIAYPLQGQAQGNPGSPVVDGTDSGGRVLKLRGLTNGHVVREGFWLNLIDGDGNRYLHQAGGTVFADATGHAVLAVEPPLRIFPDDGWAVELAKPVIEGIVTSAATWSLQLADIVGGFGLTLREAK